MAQPELRKQAQQQDRTLITAAPRRKRRGALHPARIYLARGCRKGPGVVDVYLDSARMSEGSLCLGGSAPC